jgi:hypothetical protein
MTSKIDDHVDQALNRLPYGYKGRSRFQQFLAALVKPAQSLENALWQLFTERFINTAIGAQLDALGRIVGEQRAGLSDDDYRRYIRARIATNRSRGSVEDLIKIARLVIFDSAARVVVTPHFPASLLVSIHNSVVGNDLAEILLRFLKSAKAGGVKLWVETADQDESEMFYFASTGSTYLLAASNTALPSIIVENATSFPVVGSLVLSPNTSIEETLSYSSRTSFTFVLTSSPVNTHPTDSIVELPGFLGKGFGDASDPDDGGYFASVRS